MKEELVKKVIDAWLVEGANPAFHKMMKEKLKREWPVLARAIENLAKENP
jgi:hypothetical protein